MAGEGEAAAARCMNYVEISAKLEHLSWQEGEGTFMVMSREDIVLGLLPDGGVAAIVTEF